MPEKQTILSGMRPTGPLHLGHLAGALGNWKALQDEYNCFYMVADWHALMSEYHNSKSIREFSEVLMAEWVACGIDPQRSTLFVQSHVPQHAELHLILSCVTPIGWLERCPTYKEQLQQLAAKDVNTYAFLGYPTLQAADILLYRANLVPVGEDQLPHLEVTREIARRFNGIVGEVFPEPQGKVTKSARLLGLDRRKMSKSYGNAVGLADEPEEIRSKIMSMITDPQRARRSDPGRPDYCVAHSYYEAFLSDEAPAVAEKCRTAAVGCVDCKKRLAEGLCAVLQPIREKRNELLNDRDKLGRLIEDGGKAAAKAAQSTMGAVHQALGF
ncbi:MAG TPA: tryptophan--tRNA ligase [Candidatus Brocadiia bacterium]|nr:tryptophan--tRNA ligase [Candidatus Brocadiia bacterium]